MSNETPRIEIWTRDLSGPIPEIPILGTKPQHLYIIKVNDDGTKEILRGGPVGDNMIIGDLIAVHQSYDLSTQSDDVETFDYYDSTKPENLLNHQKLVTYEFSSQDILNQTFNLALQKAGQINAEVYDYEISTQNSNTVVIQSIKAMSLDYELVLSSLSEHSLVAPAANQDLKTSILDRVFSDTETVVVWTAENTQIFFNNIKNDLGDLLHQIQAKISSETSAILAPLVIAHVNFSNATANAIPRIDPLIIDLNGDGLKLNSWQESNVTFDLNGDGFSESTGWTTASSDDAFLVLDKNSNGNVDSIDELFGNSSSTGFEVLSKFDSNADNLINSTDAQFNLLKLWKDSNANGVVNEGELTSLAENGITEISLKTINNLYSASGNLITETAEVKITDPNNPDSNTNTSARTISEVLFAMNQFNSSIVNPDEALGPDFTLDINTLLLPYSRGYGSLNSWQVAMTLNSELLETAQTLANLSPSNFYQINSLFETFLFQWADVENVTSSQVYESGTSTKIDHRKVAFLEKATGLDFRVPNDAVISQAQTSWDLFYNTLLARFLTQGTFKEIFPDASYSFSTDTTSINTSLDEAITNILSLSVSLDRNSFLNYAYYSKTILQLNKYQFINDSNSPETSTTFDAKVNTMLTSRH